MTNLNISVIVTNFNTVNLLSRYLEEVIIRSEIANEIILSDDASTDGSVSYATELSKKHPKLKVIKNKQNIGFAKNSNNAVKHSKGDFVVLLNSDIRPHPNYIENSLSHFNNSNNIFGVSFAEKGHENWAKIFWKNGYIQHLPGLEVDLPHITGWLSGGSSIINKNYFTSLGGFDAVYEPFYSEDLDLGYRAWKSGYRLLWTPSSVVEHRHESTTSKFPKRFSDYVKERNRLLNVWRNISDPSYIFQNKLALIGRVAFGPNYLKIILAAKRQMKRYPPPLVFPKITDRQIFEKFL